MFRGNYEDIHSPLILELLKLFLVHEVEFFQLCVIKNILKVRHVLDKVCGKWQVRVVVKVEVDMRPQDFGSGSEIENEYVLTCILDGVEHVG